VSFEITGDAYDRFMGRYSTKLSPQLADLAGVAAPQRVLDVGCGPGALTDELVRRVGAASVAAVDPSESFVGVVKERQPEVSVQRAAAEDLPFRDGEFDASLAQLVVHFMRDPVAGLREMARVTRPDGAIAACTWDHVPGGEGALSVFFTASKRLDPNAPAETGRPGARKGHLGELFRAAGIREVEETPLIASVVHPTFNDWWAPFMLGVGPVGEYLATLDEAQLELLKDLCREELPPEPFTVNARAWAARGAA
jgi:ubiquinone/menaquinone biosynthesis C-methylase UbiE